MLRWTQFSSVATLATCLIYPWLAYDVIGGHVLFGIWRYYYAKRELRFPFLLYTNMAV